MRNNDLILIMCPPFWEKLPPFGIANIAQYLKDRGVDPLIFDMNIGIFNLLDERKKDWTINTDYINENFFHYCFDRHKEIFNELVKMIKTNKVRYAGFSVFKNNRTFSLKTAEFLKRNVKDIEIIFGGPEVFTMSLENFRNTAHVDRFVVGEGESALYGIISGRIKDKTVSFLQLENINFYPKFEGFDLRLYARKNSLPILSSRGCVNRCAFCAEKLLFKSYRTRDAENIQKEIQFHRDKNKIKWFTFYDSSFNGDLGSCEELADAIIGKNPGINWDAQIMIRKDMSLGLMKKMKRSGCVNLFIGLESGSDRILKLMKKNFSTAEAIDFFIKLNKAALNFEISLITNYPGETESDFNMTLDFIRNNGKIVRKIAQINPYKEYPGIKLNSTAGRDIKKDGEKVEILLSEIKKAGIRYTKSFINNLI